MKTILLISGIFGLFFFNACAEETPTKYVDTPVADERTEVSRFIVSNAYVIDPDWAENFAEAKKTRKKEEYEASLGYHINESSPLSISNYLRSIRKDSTIKIYRDIKAWPLSTTEKDAIFILCDSISFVENGKTVRTYVCDSTSMYIRVALIKFYESWYINNKTKQLEKEQLGFSACEWREDKQAYTEMFTYFTDEASRQKVLTNMK